MLVREELASSYSIRMKNDLPSTTYRATNGWLPYYYKCLKRIGSRLTRSCYIITGLCRKHSFPPMYFKVVNVYSMGPIELTTLYCTSNLLKTIQPSRDAGSRFEVGRPWVVGGVVGPKGAPNPESGGPPPGKN